LAFTADLAAVVVVLAARVRERCADAVRRCCFAAGVVRAAVERLPVERDAVERLPVERVPVDDAVERVLEVEVVVVFSAKVVSPSRLG
jgi:hypothetical protein